MVPYNLQIELNARLVTFSAEQLDQLADNAGFMRYQIRTFNHHSVIYVNIEDEPREPEDIIGFSEDEVFSLDEVRTIAAAIRDYNSRRKLNFDQMHFDF
ncbi:hypothetical protein BDD43_4882 [Mucilaginibacter gracilis]|uniref:Uncharacterized protein n=1 Tax=Mucilaginibacter gracilis TaxID=423350 RepID=A0A495J6L6_9SPHI|nr:hypothetical protein [Mucilaginibacter gracilis]RKR84635.1 hypothetical protein BDD43_4882 [Mucilaginibacter gracilis]